MLIYPFNVVTTKREVPFMVLYWRGSRNLRDRINKPKPTAWIQLGLNHKICISAVWVNQPFKGRKRECEYMFIYMHISGHLYLIAPGVWLYCCNTTQCCEVIKRDTTRRDWGAMIDRGARRGGKGGELIKKLHACCNGERWRERQRQRRQVDHQRQS